MIPRSRITESKGLKNGYVLCIYCYAVSTKFEPIYNVTSKAPHVFKECSYTCFIQVQILWSSVKKGKILDGFYCRNSKLLGIEQRC